MPSASVSTSAIHGHSHIVVSIKKRTDEVTVQRLKHGEDAATGASDGKPTELSIPTHA